ncbi:unnamed protein product [Effrenium voratum]|uniref:Uncharacterized protein n=1 Tax=Effrenium voratum TaxID=2562239 RepID=A0AA36MXR6_9DINO|nr:unnamed protein product [Effrenium voratum]CAJ1417281.1 unnamed protein product [Effrenium voratum]
MAVAIHEFVNKDIGEHTFHQGEAWPNEDKKDVVFYAFPCQVKGTEPIFDYWNDKDKEHTFHFGEPWPNEKKGEHPVFFAYPLGDDKGGLLQSVHSYWNDKEKKHSFHMGDARTNEDKHEPQFLAFPTALTWNPDVACEGAPAVNRAKWFMENKGLSEGDARANVMGEFPAAFKGGKWNPDVVCDGAPAQNRAKWLMENKGLSEADARASVMAEFPAAFGGAPGPAKAGGYSGAGHFVAGRFPHSLELVKDDKGKSRLKFSVTPINPQEVTMVAVHYSVNKEPGHEDMNFDINKTVEGTNTYVHVTPDFGPVCEAGAKVTYWLGVMEKGLIAEMPEKACPHKENRLTWIAK